MAETLVCEEIEDCASFLKKTGKTYREIFQASREGYIVLSLEGRFLDCNPSFCDLTGYTREELMKLDSRDITPVTWHPMETEIFETQVRINGYSKPYLKEYVRKDGTLIAVEVRAHLVQDEAGRPVSVWAVIYDAADRIQVVGARLEGHEMLEKIVQGTPIPIFVIDGSHMVTHWNRACETLTGIAAKDVIGTRRHWQAFYSAERPVMADLIVDKKSEEDLKACYGDKYRKSSVIEGAYECTDFYPDLGEKGKWLFFTAAPIIGSGNELIGAIETLQDMTIPKTMAQDLKESEAQYKNLTENVADGVTVIQDGKIALANHAVVSMFSFSDSGQLIGRPVVDLISDAFRPAFEESLANMYPGMPEEKVFQGECRRMDGSELWIEFHLIHINWKGNPAVMSTLRDITESRMQRLAMKEEAEHLREENIQLRSDVSNRYRFGDIIGKSPAMQKVYELILQAAASNASVIIHGESGTGKELVSHAIHKMSPRKDKAFVPVNCGAIPENLIESEFFGYKKGAFTGANSDKIGYLDLADGGTLFLDEVGEIGLNMQVKLLRAIEEGGFMPVGSSQITHPDIRIIAATNKSLSDMVSKGQMRKDFYYRINIIPIQLPPLRERKEDLTLLMDHFLRTFSPEKQISPLPGKIIEAFMNYEWPGNVRELQNMLQRYISLKNFDFLSEMPSFIPVVSEGIAMDDILERHMDLQSAVEVLEKRMIGDALNRVQWHRGRAAEMLKVDRKTLYSKIKKYGLAKH